MAVEGRDSQAHEVTDEELVARVRAGDDTAAQTLFDRHVDRLRVRVRKRLPQVVRAKVSESDVIQEAYMTAFGRLDDFESRGDGSFGRWIGRILENKIRDEVRRYLGTEQRRAQREVRITAAGGEQVRDRRQATPSADAIAHEDRTRLLAAMDRMSEADQVVLHGVHDDRLRFTELGARLGIQPDAARMRYTRALSRLTEQLRSNGDA